MQLQASYIDGRYREELVEFIERNCGPNEPYCLTVIYKCNLTQEELNKENMRLYAPGQRMNDAPYGPISYNCSLSNTSKLKLGHNVKIFLVETKAATGKDIAEYVMRPAKVIPPSQFRGSEATLLISIPRLRGHLMKTKE